jgi:hypothetical protein
MRRKRSNFHDSKKEEEIRPALNLPQGPSLGSGLFCPGKLIASDTEKWAKVIRAANIKAE